MKGWKFWLPESNMFIESAHARWLDEKDNSPSACSAPIPDPSSSSSLDRILNNIEARGHERDVRGLFSSLMTEFKLEGSPFTKTVREQEAMITELNAMAAGTAMNLPRSYHEAITGEHGEEWKRACNKEIEMLRGLKVWKEVKVSANQKVVPTKWAFVYKYNVDGEITKRKAWFVV